MKNMLDTTMQHMLIQSMDKTYKNFTNKLLSVARCKYFKNLGGNKMKKIWSYIELMQKKLVWAIPIFMIMGIIYGTLFNPTNLKNLVMPLTFLMVYPIMVTLKINELLLASCKTN